MHAPHPAASPLLAVRNLTVSYATASGPFRALRDVSLDIQPGEVLGVVGETGCGKSTLALSIPGLLDGGWIETGVILFEGRDLVRISAEEWRRIRGRRIGLIFQNPRESLNPVLTIDSHFAESIRAHRKMTRGQARNLAVHLLEELGVPDPRLVLRRYSFELSGGTCQRIAIALAICNEPSLLIADEPTSALDPTIQSQIIGLLDTMRRRHQLSLLLISHDIPMITGIADRLAVMYAGRVVERGPAREVLTRPAHPYTRGLINCIPDIDCPPGSQLLNAIPGAPPGRFATGPGCAFAPRCHLAENPCTRGEPELVGVSHLHQAACIKAATGA
ncbi:MAG: ABC transporter ATP-binding protein [Acidobacteria bacterium]|nr:ABC transporter ATP-binding protein [Acidobacteriota bacterium]